MDTNQTEMKTLIGLIILQGIVQKPENGMCFSKMESTVLPLFTNNDREKIPSPPKIPSL
jgi:hypothetical protein